MLHCNVDTEWKSLPIPSPLWAHAAIELVKTKRKSYCICHLRSDTVGAVITEHCTIPPPGDSGGRTTSGGAGEGEGQWLGLCPNGR